MVGILWTLGSWTSDLLSGCSVCCSSTVQFVIYSLAFTVRLQSWKTNCTSCRNSEISQLAFLFALNFPSAAREMWCSPAGSGFTHLSSSCHWPVPLTSLCPSRWDSSTFWTHLHNKDLHGHIFFLIFLSFTYLHTF